MRKKLLLAFIVGSCISAASAVSSSDLIQAHLFPRSIYFNNQHANKQSGAFELLNYNGSVYVPLRYMAENMGGKVHYDEANQDIYIDRRVNNLTKAEISVSKQADNFMLNLHSEKEAYKSNEIIHLWSSLVYLGEEEITVGHGNPIILFSVRDEEGISSDEYIETVLIRDQLKKNNEYKATLPLNVIESYNYNKKGRPDIKKFLEKERSWQLSPGKYTVRVTADFSIDGDKKDKIMKSEITIQVEPQ
ncbi:stalk domain-containing protein [Paenibacillus elgii]|uniref:stalk domain-containing protein n=1 Tax=Paenibacillus elgii TaxID=189691 RepID=UPI0030DC77B6